MCCVSTKHMPKSSRLARLKLWQFTKLNHKNQITMYTKIAFQSFHLNKCYAIYATK